MRFPDNRFKGLGSSKGFIIGQDVGFCVCAVRGCMSFAVNGSKYCLKHYFDSVRK